MDKRAELIDLVVTEIDRIFGPGGFDGEPGQYEWLLSNVLGESADPEDHLGVRRPHDPV